MVQYDVTTPEEYFTAIEDDWRKTKLLEVRELINKYAPEVDENIRYKMLNYGLAAEDDYIFALNAQKHYVSFYVGSIERIENAAELLADYNYGKGCIRIRKTINIADTGLEEFIEKTVASWRAGEDVYC